jgi:hypothetical protein
MTTTVPAQDHAAVLYDLNVNMAGLAALVTEAQAEIIEAAKSLTKCAEDLSLEPDSAKLDAILAACTTPDPLPEATHRLTSEVLALLRVVHAAHVVTVTRPPWWRDWRRARWPGVAVLTLALGLGVGRWWAHPPGGQRAWVQLGSQLDTLLVVQYPALPKALQGSLDTIYRQCGLQSPGDRKGKRA